MNTTPSARRYEMVPYGYLNGDRKDPRWYENQHPEQHDTATATVWTLHFALKPDLLEETLAPIRSHNALTGEYTYDFDSFKEWGTPTDDENDQHLALYFRSDPANAWFVGAGLAEFLGVGEFYVSTAGDYAEQVTRP